MKIIISIVYCIVFILAQLLIYNVILSKYALNHWWIVRNIDLVSTIATICIASAGSLFIGYTTKLWWISGVSQILLAFLTGLALSSFNLVMQNLLLPASIIIAFMFGWIGMMLSFISTKR